MGFYLKDSKDKFREMKVINQEIIVKVDPIHRKKTLEQNTTTKKEKAGKIFFGTVERNA